MPESWAPLGRFGFKVRSILKHVQYVSLLDTYDTQRLCELMAYVTRPHD